MTLFSVLTRLLCGALLALPLSGCFPGNDIPADEEKDPHYLAGKNRLSSMDFDAAINAFENALVANPKSAAAHLELGLLYEEKKNDYASAIYHFNRHLQLRPDSNMAETIKQRIYSCKLELAKTVSFALISRQVQDDIRRLSTTNSALREQIDQLKSQLLDQAVSFSNRLAQVVQVAASKEPVQTFQPVEPERRQPPAERAIPTPPAASRSPVHQPSAARTYTIKPGDSLANIAKKYNVRMSTLQTLNPTVDSHKLRTGQTLILPAGKY